MCIEIQGNNLDKFLLSYNFFSLGLVDHVFGPILHLDTIDFFVGHLHPVEEWVNYCLVSED